MNWLKQWILLVIGCVLVVTSWFSPWPISFVLCLAVFPLVWIHDWRREKYHHGPIAYWRAMLPAMWGQYKGARRRWWMATAMARDYKITDRYDLEDIFNALAYTDEDEVHEALAAKQKSGDSMAVELGRVAMKRIGYQIGVGVIQGIRPIVVGLDGRWSVE